MTKTAISALILAIAPSVVSAAPAKDETAERVSYNDEKEKSDSPDGWVELASPTPAKHGRTYITVDGRYAQLRVDRHKGRPVVKTVRIVYSDGKQRTVKINSRKRSSVIDLAAGSTIEHIVVTTDWRSKGTYTVSAMPAEAAGVATR
jgi:hypothetical protein